MTSAAGSSASIGSRNGSWADRAGSASASPESYWRSCGSSIIRAMPRDSTTLFEDAIDVPLWLEADRLTPYAERVRRDREIARRIRAAAVASQRVRAWWRSAAPRRAEPALARGSARLRTLVTVAMAAVGSITGVAVALAAFAYDGSQPVNVVRLLALLVGVQLVLLALTLLLLPRPRAGLAPHARSLDGAESRRLGGRRVRQARARDARCRAAVRPARPAPGGAALREMAAALLVADGRGHVQRCRARHGDHARDVLRSRIRLEHDARRRPPPR